MKDEIKVESRKFGEDKLAIIFTEGKRKDYWILTIDKFKALVKHIVGLLKDEKNP